MILIVTVKTVSGTNIAYPYHIPNGDYITGLQVDSEHGTLLFFPFQLTGDGMYVKREPESINGS